jgi:DNA replication protein
MKSSKLIEIYQDGNIVIPIYMIKNYQKLKLELEEFIFLMYLYSKGNNFIFNPVKMKEELGIKLEKVMENISSLSDKKLIKVDVVKNEKGILEEIINIDDFFHKLSLLIVDDVANEEKSQNSNIFEIIEKEFGRTLSPIEYEIIKAWLDNNMSEEIIKEALKEATFNGVSNLRYIDKILYEWGKSGIKTKEDVEKNRKKRERKKQEEIKDIDLDIMEWDWFDDDDE